MLPRADESWTRNEAAHLLNRAGFGGSPEEIDRLHALGRTKAVESLLTTQEPPDFMPQPAWADHETATAEAREFNEKRRNLQQETAGKTPEEREKAKREAFKNIQQRLRQRGVEAQAWWFRRILATRAPLREKMTLFWHDHFATSLQKVKQPVFMIRQNQLFRAYALGDFRALTGKVLRDPAMMLYLDTQNSKKGMPNENFAREVMELFTLGEGQYTEQDIREAARALTGYQLNRITGAVSRTKRAADDTPKTIFGKTGNYNGDDVVSLIFEKPRAAEFMTRKLWEYFVYENPAEKPITLLADGFRRANYQIAPLLREIFLSREFYSEAAIRSQIKCPVQYLTSLFKQTGITEPPRGLPLAVGQQLGQQLFLPPNVAGWDWGKAWINTNTLLTRYNIAGYVTKGIEGGFQFDGGDKFAKIAGNQMRRGPSFSGPDYEVIAPRPLRESPEKLVDALVSRFFQGPVPPRARESFLAYAVEKKGVIFTNKEVAELCHLMLSTPYYQLC